MTTIASPPTKWAAQKVEDAFASAVISGIVPDQAHLNTGGYHVSIEDLARYGNAGDYSNRRWGDKAPPVTAQGKRLAAAFDVSMGVADMKRVHANVRRVWLDRSDPRRKYINAINCWDGYGDAVRYDFQSNSAYYATPDHKWHKHSDQPRMYVDVYRNEAEAWLAARAIVSVITGQSKAAWIAATSPPPPAPPARGIPTAYQFLEDDMATIVGFVMFKDDKGKDLDGEGVYAVFSNGVVRACLPIEFFTLREGEGAPYAKVPIRREHVSQKPRYQSYDNALRATKIP